MEYKLEGNDAPMPDGTEPLAEAKIIEQHGQVQKFSFNQIVGDLLGIRKKIESIKTQRLVEQAKVDNIEAHHPFVKDLPEFDRYTVHMYQEAFAMTKACDSHLAILEEAEQSTVAELQEIKTQIPELAEAVIPAGKEEAVPAVTPEESDGGNTPE